MLFWDKILNAVKGNEDFSEFKSSTFRDYINGNILNKRFIRKQYKLLILIAVLFFFYIDNRYFCEKQVSQEVRLKKELQDIKFESLTISAQLTTLSRRTYVLDYIRNKELGLGESARPPVLLDRPDTKEAAAVKKAHEAHRQATEKIRQDTTHNEETIAQ